MSFQRTAATWALATLAGGLWLGIVGRVVMTTIAVAAGNPPRWSAGGTIEIIVFGIAVSAIYAAFWMLVRRRMPALRIGRGLLPGGVMFLGMVVQPPPSAQSALGGVGQRGPSIVLFGLLFLGFGVVVEAVLSRRDAPAPPSAGRP